MPVCRGWGEEEALPRDFVMLPKLRGRALPDSHHSHAANSALRPSFNQRHLSSRSPTIPRIPRHPMQPSQSDSLWLPSSSGREPGNILSTLLCKWWCMMLFDA